MKKKHYYVVEVLNKYGKTSVENSNICTPDSLIDFLNLLIINDNIILTVTLKLLDE